MATNFVYLIHTFILDISCPRGAQQQMRRTLLQRSIDGTDRQTDTHTDPFNGHLSRTTQVSRYQKGKTNLDFTETRDSEWQWHQLGYMQVCVSLQTDNHASTPPLKLLQARCPSCSPTNSVKALKALQTDRERKNIYSPQSK